MNHFHIDSCHYGYHNVLHSQLSYNYQYTRSISLKLCHTHCFSSMMYNITVLRIESNAPIFAPLIKLYIFFKKQHKSQLRIKLVNLFWNIYCTRNMSSRSSCNSQAFVWELQENLDDIISLRTAHQKLVFYRYVPDDISLSRHLNKMMATKARKCIQSAEHLGPSSLIESELFLWIIEELRF